MQQTLRATMTVILHLLYLTVERRQLQATVEEVLQNDAIPLRV